MRMCRVSVEMLILFKSAPGADEVIASAQAARALGDGHKLARVRCAIHVMTGG